jgi:manganese transport protein
MVFLDPSREDFVLDRTRAFLRGPRAPRAALARLLAFAGPTFIASVAYLDPGNFATNITAGATHGYQLLWVVLVANIMAMLFQALSAKLGIVTGRSLARICHDRLPPPLTRILWVVSEVGAIATDLAELLGASIGCSEPRSSPALCSPRRSAGSYSRNISRVFVPSRHSSLLSS